MPTVTVYLNKALDAAVKREKVPVSTVCQVALRAEVESRREHKQEASSEIPAIAKYNRRQ
jgi:post-segregation antitoxin (ccd killing protein)